MVARNFNLRGIKPEVMAELKNKAKQENTSVNILILKSIESSVGLSQENKRPVFHDLDKLAGVWSEEDAKEFAKNSKDFEKIDKDLWT